MKPFDIVIVANSAGELSALVRPAVDQIKKDIEAARIIIVLTPCQYATGRELEEAKSFGGIYRIIATDEYKSWVMRGKSPQGISFNESGLVLYMGGDLLHAVLISKKLKYPAIAYAQKHAQWKNKFLSFLVPDQQAFDHLKKKGVPEAKLKIVGDLMVDSIPAQVDLNATRSRWGIRNDQIVISFLPGSRPFQIHYMIPLFLLVAEKIRKQAPQAQLLLILSPYMTEDKISVCLGNTAAIVSGEGFRFIELKSGAKIKLITEARHEVIKLSTLILTIPGTNTAEIAALGTPMISIFPMDRPDQIPLEGIMDWPCRIPFLGVLLKRFIVNIINKRTKYFALPNIKAGREIVPEFRGKISEAEVARRAVELASDGNWLSKTSQDLKKAMGMRGAAKNLVNEILSIMEKEQ